MKQFNNKVGYIWVGEKDLPKEYWYNFEQTKIKNNGYDFSIYGDSHILSMLDSDWRELYKKSSLFHKLQIGKYTILNKIGGIICDFDIEWKLDFSNIYEKIDECNLVMCKRKSLYFFNKGKGRATLLDDFVLMGKVGCFDGYLQWCLDREERKDEETEPFSVYALTEWSLDKENISYLTPEQIYDSGECEFGYHKNKKSWEQK